MQALIHIGYRSNGTFSLAFKQRADRDCLDAQYCQAVSVPDSQNLQKSFQNLQNLMRRALPAMAV